MPSAPAGTTSHCCPPRLNPAAFILVYGTASFILNAALAGDRGNIRLKLHNLLCRRSFRSGSGGNGRRWQRRDVGHAQKRRKGRLEKSPTTTEFSQHTRLQPPHPVTHAGGCRYRRCGAGPGGDDECWVCTRVVHKGRQLLSVNALRGLQGASGAVAAS